jgi:predicted nucleic-acid-binding protein
MKAVDTNVLVRILVDDAQREQVNLARQFAKKAGQLFIVQIVQVELVWVLEGAYGLSKADIMPILQHLQANEAFVLQHAAQYDTALQCYQAATVGFADCLILAASSEAGDELVTFDKKFARLPQVKLLTI